MLQFSPCYNKPLNLTNIEKNDEEVAFLSLAPFSGIPKICFDNIPIGHVSVQKLLIKNPTNVPVQLTVDTNFPDDITIALNWNEAIIESQLEALLEITWTPQKEGAWRHILRLQDHNRIKRDIPIVFKSIRKISKSTIQRKQGKRSPKPLSSTRHHTSKENKLPRLQPQLNYGENKENQNGNCSNLTRQVLENDQRSTFCVKAALNAPNSNSNSEKFDDSLEMPSPTRSPAVCSRNYPEALTSKLDGRSFELSLVTPQRYDLHPKYCSTGDKSTTKRRILATISDDEDGFTPKLKRSNLPRGHNISTGTYVKGNISSETYVKDEISFRTYVLGNSGSDTFVNGNVSSGTFVKEPLFSPTFSKLTTSNICRLESLSGLGAKTVIQANLWNDSTQKQIKPIIEEPLKHQITSYKRANTEKNEPISDWSKRSKIALRLLSQSKILNLKRNQLTHSNQKKVIIQDPFILAATSTFDPFLTSSIYFSEEWMNAQEENFKKWLNALLTPPTEMVTNANNHPIDVAKLWKECEKRTEVKCAPTKEVVSLNYHNNSRLNQLRRAAKALFWSSEIGAVLAKVMAAVDANKLTVRADRNIHLDLMLLADTMSVLLSYNTLWLRIGLETIFNTQIALTSNSDILGISAFLREHLFKDPFLLKKHKSIYSPKYTIEIKRHILKKVLILVYFLDKAKMKKLIQHDPCLFCKNAPIKESREALLKFARDSISSMGDVTKYLKHFGYIVTHKQSYLDEFDYAVNILGVDLRDGVRLTKVLEIILLEDGLSRELRVPAISRMQKVHNIEVVFKALKKFGFDIQFDIIAKDIVDGHKEKTLSFLWQIIYKFQAPLMVKQVTIIQKWWRSGPLLAKRAILKKQKAKKEAAALKIANWYKKIKLSEQLLELVKIGLLYRNEMRRNRAALKIQSFMKMAVCRLKYDKIKRSIIGIQSHCRKMLIKQMYHHKRITAVIKIQSYYRMYAAKSHFTKLKWAVLVIEAKYEAIKLMRIEYIYYQAVKIAAIFVQRKLRANCARKRFVALKKAATTIQRQYRANKLRDNERNRYQTLRENARKIQVWFRTIKQMRIVRNRFLVLKWAAVEVQRRIRANNLMKIDRDYYLALKSAAITIQQRYRAKKIGFIENQYYQVLKKSTIQIQQKFRAMIAMKKKRSEFIKFRNATIIIQNRFRAMVLMKKEQNNYLALKSATITIQQRFRAKKIGLIMYNHYQILKISTIKIQQTFRAMIAMKKERSRFIKLRNAAIIIQNRYRAMILRKKEQNNYLALKSASITIQRRFRAKKIGSIKYHDYQILKKSTIKIQQKFRATIAMKKERSEFIKFRNATIIIQNRFRAMVLMKKEQHNYLALKSATKTIQQQFRAKKIGSIEYQHYQILKISTIKIQQIFRAMVAMKKERSGFIKLRNATIIIQNRFRAMILRKKEQNNYLALKSATITIQRRFRAKKIGLIKYYDYQILKKSTIKIQQTFRAMIAMKKDRSGFIRLRNATIIIQTRFRAMVLMKKEQKNYLALKSATITIQQRFRAKKIGSIECQNYQILKISTIKIQQIFRAMIAMKKERSRFIKLRNATIIIQNRFRAMILRKKEHNNYLALKSATITIQRRFRAKKIGSIKYQNYQILKISTIKIQQTFRAMIAMKKERFEFTRLRNATINIQNRFRAMVLMKKEQNNYLALKSTTISIQQRFRAKKIGSIEYQHYQILKISTIKIQQTFRAMIAMKKERSGFIKLRNATINIQNRFRAMVLMKKEQNNYLALKSTTISIQQRFRAKKIGPIVYQHYQILKISTIKIQQRVRAMIAMKRERSAFIRLRNATITVQQKYRANIAAKIRRRELLFLKSVIFVQRQFRRKQEIRRVTAAVVMQKYARRYLAQKNFQVLLILAEQRRIEKIQNDAAMKIQSLWRGHRTRLLEIKELSSIRQKSKEANKNAKPQNTLGSRRDRALNTLSASEKNLSIHQMMKCFEDLDYVTRRCKLTCEKLAPFLSKPLYENIGSTNRSLPQMQLNVVAIQILINFYRYEPTRIHCWKPEFLDMVFNLMKHSCDKECEVFPALCSLLWLFAHNSEYKKIIVGIPNFDTKMKKIEVACSRKERMVIKSGIKGESLFDEWKRLPLPCRTPDWGLENNLKPRVFRNSLQAFKCLSIILSI